MVGNHSGGLMAMDVPIIAVAFAETFGADRPLYCLAHDMLFTGVAGPVMRRFGFVPADRESAQAVLTSGAVTIVFPGGDYDVFRPTLQANVIDFEGRKGYVRTALKAGVPIVPVVSIGGQEAQLHLTRGQWLGRMSPLRKAFRTDLMPLTIGFPFGLTAAGVPNIPLPTKIVTQVLDPIDLRGRSSAPTWTSPRSRGRARTDAGGAGPAGSGAKVPGARMSSHTNGPLRTQLWATGHLLRSRMIAPMSPRKYVGMTRILRSYGPHATTGFALSANRRPDGIGLIDDRGSLTWRELEARAAALAVGLATTSDRPPTSVAILCRNHRGFVDVFVAAGRLGVPALLLNTGFSAPQLADVLEREQATLIVYDEEFAGLVAEARARIPGLVEVLGWVEDESAANEKVTAEQLIAAHRGQQPPTSRPGRVVLLTSGTTGTPKGANRSGGGSGRAGRHARADPVARRGDHRRRGADLPRVGHGPAGHRGDDGVHGRAATEVRPRGDAGPGGPSTGRPGSGWSP